MLAGYSLMTFIAAYIGSAVVFFALDFVWLSFVALGFYRSEIGHVLLERPNLVPAAVFYLFYVVGVVFFAVLPALNNQSWLWALLAGIGLGLIAYGTYDMTNLATIKDWSWKVSLVDVLWGGFLTGISAMAGYWVARFTL
ncbi:DUF2177 family protein [Devosia sp. 63-57]|uniref:DUF2177 family protein n=1 Tax=Devosia sp. 63-57 TaxID=1895751 RepID=UPI000A85F28C|nr:DUF2177 family protein [Devosia sp. 63-57]